MIITNNEAALRIPCQDALLDDVSPIILSLEGELENSERLGRKGIGLAAPQCSISKKIAIVRMDNLYSVNLVNAKISNAYDQIMFKDEGCLSFPNRVENTLRYQEIHVIDNLVEPHSFIATGLFAICIQHEIDHLNGILLPDIALPKVSKTINPNDPCVCKRVDEKTGKIKKFKKCCGEKL